MRTEHVGVDQVVVPRLCCVQVQEKIRCKKEISAWAKGKVIFCLTVGYRVDKICDAHMYSCQYVPLSVKNKLIPQYDGVIST